MATESTPNNVGVACRWVGFEISQRCRQITQILQKRDRYLFGHEHGKFDSPNKFFEHFRYMMEERRIQCSCINCSRETDQPTVKSDSRLGLDGGDELYSRLEKCFKACEDDAASEVDIEWERSFPTRVLPDEKEIRDIVTRYQKQPSSLPRMGELVLFYCDTEGSGRFEQLSQQFKLYDNSRSCFRSYPLWRAGVISHEPRIGIGLVDLTQNDTMKAIDIYPYGIKLLTGPEAEEETSVNHTLYIALSHIRPLSMFHEMLSGIPQNTWHATIYHALTSMCTINIIGPVRFFGRWPHANIECSGLWIGPELLILGDTVRLLPPRGRESSPIDTVLVIDEIEWAFDDLSVSRSSRICLRGKSYTVDKGKALGCAPLNMGDEGTSRMSVLATSFSSNNWYLMCKANENGDADIRLSHLGDDIEVSASLVVGRLYEPKAMEFLLDGLDFDISDLGVQQGRRWAKARMCPGATSDPAWILTKDRIEALRMSVGRSTILEERRESTHTSPRNQGSSNITQTFSSDPRNKHQKGPSIASDLYFSNQDGKGTPLDIDGNRTTPRPVNIARQENTPLVNSGKVGDRRAATIAASSTAENESEENGFMSNIPAINVMQSHRSERYIGASIIANDEYDDHHHHHHPDEGSGGKQKERPDMAEREESESDGEESAGRGEQAWKRLRTEEEKIITCRGVRSYLPSDYHLPAAT